MPSAKTSNARAREASPTSTSAPLLRTAQPDTPYQMSLTNTVASTELVPHHHTACTRETSTCQEPPGTKTSAWNALAQPLQTLTVNTPANVPASSAVNAAQDTPTYQYQANAAETA